MSIYKTPTTLWNCIEGKSQEDAIDHTVQRIIGILQTAPNDWFSMNDCIGIFAAYTIWQQEYLIAAWRTIQLQDKVRYNSHNNKIQYRPSNTETNRSST